MARHPALGPKDMPSLASAVRARFSNWCCKPMREVTPGDADCYKVHLIGKKLAPMRIHKRLQFAAMTFRAALRRRLIAESLFADVSIKASMPNRERFITADETTKLLNACPNHHWKAIVAL